MNDEEKKKAEEEIGREHKEIHGEDFQFVLKALLAVYEPILEEDLRRAKEPEELKKEAESRRPNCEDEVALADRIFDKFFTEQVAQRLIPDKEREQLIKSETWRWCLWHIRCCIKFGWLICRGPRTFRSFVYYTHRYWRCVREALGTPVHSPLTEEERKDFYTLTQALGGAFKPYLTDQLASIESLQGIPDEVLAGKIDCHEGEVDAAAIFERFLTVETAPALLGKEAFERHSKEPYFWFCRCWCLCAIRFGCCLAKARNFVDVLRCLLDFFRCIRDCFKPLICEISSPTMSECVAEESDPVKGIEFIKVLGSATGAQFHHYTLTISGPYAYTVTYPAGGGTVPVVGGLLGTIDTTALDHGDYTVTLSVFPVGGGAPEVCSVTFTLLKIAVYITRAAGVPAVPNCFDETAELISGMHIRSLGGAFHLEGAAYIYACTGRKVERYELRWTRVAFPGPGPSQPLNDTPIPAAWPAGNQLHTPLVYDPSKYWPWTEVGQMPANLINDWGTLHVGPPSPGGTDYPVLSPSSWESRGATGNPGGGRFSLLLIVRDTAGHTYYDLQRIWLDNFPVVCQLVKFQKPGVLAGTWEDIPACTDIQMSWRRIRIIGLAWDSLTDAAWPTTAPNDNFDHYSLSYQKQFSPAADAIPILPTLDHPWLAPTVRVPNTLPVMGLPDLLAEWDLTTLDAGVAPGGDCGTPLPPGQLNKLYRHCSCTYTLSLGVDDTTVSETVYDYGIHHPSTSQPIKIVNDL